MSENISHEQLWANVLRNDMQALERIYKKFYPDLFMYAQKLTGSSSMAEDAVQDTFLYLWQHRQQIGVIQSLRFYLIRSVRNTCLKLIQKKKNLGSLEDVDTHLQLVIYPNELQLTDESSAVKTQLEKAFGELSRRQREIIFLKFYNNLDYEEIGEVLNINYQSVVNHVHKAVQKLRKSQTLKYFKSL